MPRHRNPLLHAIRGRFARTLSAAALCLGAAGLAGCSGFDAADSVTWPEFPGVESEWHGFVRHDFAFDGRDCIVVSPRIAAARGRPWIWRARFFGHEPQADIALLERGFHLAYVDVAGLFGAPAAVAHWDAFHGLLTTEYGLSRKPALEGMSRGGLIIYNWAKQNPDKVACIYGDAPVCDIRSWPGSRPGAENEWRQCLEAYGISEEEARDFRGNPIDGLEPLARARVPLLHICGEADDVVPMKDNTDVLAARYHALGGRIEVISKPGVGHHPHSLENPEPIVSFVLRATGFAH